MNTRVKTLNIMSARRQAVTTKRTESGIVVKAQAGSMRIKRDFSLNSDQQHAAALESFVTKWAWHGTWIDNNTMAWVNTEATCHCVECVGI